MTQKELVKLYKELNEDYEINYSKPSTYFKTYSKHLLDVQDGIANEFNFFDSTMTLFKEVSKPRRKADFESDSGSRYWYTKDGVIRGSNHWGCHVANCDWILERKDGKKVYGTSCWSTKNFKEELFGYVKWKDFVLKPRLLKIKNKEVLTTFNNKIGRDIIKLDKKKYQAQIVWKEIKD